MPVVNPRNIRSSRPPSLPQVIRDVLDPRPFVRGAYWSATHPRERLTSGDSMEFPWGAKFPPKSYSVGPDAQALKAVRLPISRNVPKTSETRHAFDYEGSAAPTDDFFLPAAGYGRGRNIRAGGTPVSYNFVNEKTKRPVGSIHMVFDPDKTIIHEVFLNERYQGNFSTLRDIIGPALDRGLPIEATPANPKLSRLLNTLMQRDDKVKVRAHHGVRPETREETIAKRRQARINKEGKTALDLFAEERRRERASKPEARYAGHEIQMRLREEQRARLRRALAESDRVAAARRPLSTQLGATRQSRPGGRGGV